MTETPTNIAELYADLAPREREALALAGEAGLGYDEVADVLGIAADQVGHVVAAARLRIADGLRHTALVPSLDDACWDNAALVAAQLDDQDLADGDGAARDHGAACARCAQARAAQVHAAREYRAWQAQQPSLALRERTLREAAALLASTPGDIAS